MKEKLLKQLFENLDRPKNRIARRGLGNRIEKLMERERWLMDLKKTAL